MKNNRCDPHEGLGDPPLIYCLRGDPSWMFGLNNDPPRVFGSGGDPPSPINARGDPSKIEARGDPPEIESRGDLPETTSTRHEPFSERLVFRINGDKNEPNGRGMPGGEEMNETAFGVFNRQKGKKEVPLRRLLTPKEVREEINQNRFRGLQPIKG